MAVAALSLPYLLLYALAPPGGVFAGVYHHGPSDSYAYLASMYHANHGEYLFTNYFTYRQLPGIPVYFIYVLAGRLIPGDATPLSLGVAYQVVRMVLVGVFIWQLVALYREVIPNAVAQRVGLALALFGTGFGIWQEMAGIRIAGQHAFDVFWTESSNFLSLLYAPHFVLGLVATVVFLRAVLRIAQHSHHSWRAAIVAGVAGMVLVEVHPEKLVLLGLTAALIAGWLAVRGRLGFSSVGQLSTMLVLASPFFLLAIVWYLGNPVANKLISQGVDPVRLKPIYYLMGYGLPGLLALAGLPRLRHLRSLSPAEAVLWSAVGAHVIIFLLPENRLIHRGEGLALVLDALAARHLVAEVMPRVWRSRAFATIARRPDARRRLRELSVNLVPIVSAAGAILLVAVLVSTGPPQQKDLFLRADDVAALAYISHSASPSDVAVGTFATNDYLAAYGGVHVVFGHLSATPNLGEEIADSDRFFAQESVSEEYLRSRSVRWLYFGPREAVVAKFDPDKERGLTRRFQSGSTTVYEVSRPT
jgi:hypothetical protein